jgi:hypothetical protein
MCMTNLETKISDFESVSLQALALGESDRKKLMETLKNSLDGPEISEDEWLQDVIEECESRLVKYGDQEPLGISSHELSKKIRDQYR